MRVPLSWLKEFVDITLPPEELAQRLTLAGMEVGSIDYIGVDGAELPWEPDKVLIGNILEVRQHPNADRLVLVEVDYGAAAPHTVVTGAPNLYDYRDKGPLTHPLKSVFAKENAELYDGHAEGQVKVKLKGRPVRGIMSNAMLCSEKELGLSDEHEGILILPEDAPTGAPLRDYLGDVVLDIDLTPNMARALSILGVAREVAALTGQTVRLPATPVTEHGQPVAERARVSVETPDLCPRFIATLVEGITVGPSPLWMQRRLLMAGMRPIFNIVDISNYVMLELGDPNHAYDADQVAEQHLVVRQARAGEKMTTLDGKERTLTANMLVVADPKQALGLAGVMGGASSEVSATTTRVLLETAIWEPTLIRRTAREMKLQSEASRRFERGVDYELPPLAQRRALSLIQQIAGGTVAPGVIDVYPQPWQPVELELAPREVTRIVGITLSADEIAVLLRPLGFGCEVTKRDDGEVVHVIVPSFRQDVAILADLCEEVARMYGYDRVPTTLLSDDLPAQHGNPLLELEEQTRDVLVGCGLDEVITYSLTNMASVAKINPADADAQRYLRLANPATPEREYLRQSLLPTLLEALATNLREYDRVLLFEVGHAYLPRVGAVLPDEPRRLAIALAGQQRSSGWSQQQNQTLDFFDLKGIVEVLLERLNVAAQVRFVAVKDDPRFHPGRAARLERRSDGVYLGVVGELHPAVRDRLEVNTPRLAAAELELDPLFELVQPVTYKPISRFPATVQDLAVIVDLNIPADRVADSIRKYAGKQLESLALFDVYEGAQIGAGHRSLAYRLAFRALDRTLSDGDISKTRAKIIKGLQHELGASIRS